MISSLKEATKIQNKLLGRWMRSFITIRLNSAHYPHSSNQNNPALVNEIRKYLYSKNVKAVSGHTCFKCESIFPSAKSSTKTKKTDPKNMYINKTTGDFLCMDTGRTGSWRELRDFAESTSFKAVAKIPTKFLRKCDDEQKINECWQNSTPLVDLPSIILEEELSRFGLDVIPSSDLQSYDLRLDKSSSASSLIIPWFTNSNLIGFGKRASKSTLIGLKKISLDAQGALDFQRFPVEKFYCMLGMSHVPLGTPRIVLTMNEFDAIAINSASSNYKAASLPCGITHLPIEVLPYLETFSEIILWFDDRQISWEAARQFARKLGDKRCRLVRPSADIPRALKAMTENLNLDKIIMSSISAEIKHITSSNVLREFVKDDFFNSEYVSGVKWIRFPKLSAKLKGHRRGELTVLTGSTGSGKTTFMSEYSLDLAQQGVSTLWGSFEIKNPRLLKTMVKQFARTKIEDQLDKFDEVYNRFEMIPLHFMTYTGPQSIKDVIHTMRQAVYVHDIQHIIIDNLQFMMGSMMQSNDRFMLQDMLIGEFRRFATSVNIHVTIVIHPRKEDPGLPLQISSIYGSAKATQEADNILILQQVSNVQDGITRKRSYIEIVKNRYDGDLGKIPLRFDRDTLCMSFPPDVDPAEEEMREVLKPVMDEAAIKLNGNSGSVVHEAVYPDWVKSCKDEVDD